MGTNKDSVDVDIDQWDICLLTYARACACAQVWGAQTPVTLLRPGHKTLFLNIKYKIIFSFQNKTKINNRFEPRR